MEPHSGLYQPARLAQLSGPARIILGGRFGEESKELSWERLDRFVEAGGKIVDTAHSYAGGRSEQVIGEWIGANPGSLLVVDKIGHPDDNGFVDLSPRKLQAEVTDAQRRLGVSPVDVVMLHRDSPAVPIEQIADTLVNLVAHGTTREVGVSNWSAARLAELLPALAVRGHIPLVSYQRSLAVPLAPLWPGARHADPQVSRVAARHQLIMLAWAAQARGFFTGRTEPPSPGQPDPFDSPTNHDRRQRCRQLARDLGSRPETVALAWLLHQRNTLPIVGPRSVAEVCASMEACRVCLDADTLRWLDRGTP